MPSPKMASASGEIFEQANLTLNKRAGMTILGLHASTRARMRRTSARISSNSCSRSSRSSTIASGLCRNQHADQQIERAVGHRMRVGIGEEGAGPEILVNVTPPATCTSLTMPAGRRSGNA